MADNDQARGRLRPSRGWFILCGVAVVLGGTVVGLSYWVTSRNSAPSSHVSAAPSTENNTPGGKANPHYNKLVSQQNQQKEKRAESSGQSFMPTVVGTHSNQSFQLATKSKSATQTPPPTPVDINTSSEPKQTSQHNTQAQSAQQHVGARSSAMVNELKHIMKQEAPAKAMVAVYSNSQTQQASTASTASDNAESQGQATMAKAQAGSDQSHEHPVKPGTIFYAVMDTALDSDQPGPAMATVVSGPYKGAKVLGGFKRHKDSLVVQFSRLIPKNGPVQPIKAYAVNTATTRTAVATAVNHHYLARWGGLIAASFMEGFGRAVEQSGSTVVNTVGSGGASSLTIHPSRTAGAEAEQALGTVGQKAGQQIQKNFNEPPTVKVAAGTAIDVLIIRGNKHASSH